MDIVDKLRKRGFSPTLYDALNIMDAAASEIKSLRSQLQQSEARVKELEKESEIDYELIQRLSGILERSVNLIRGEPPELTKWSFHDLPELIEQVLVDCLAEQLATHVENDDE